MSKVSQSKKTGSSATSTKKKVAPATETASLEIAGNGTNSCAKEAMSSDTCTAKASEVGSFLPCESAIREQAYFIWEKEGYQHGCDTEHWLKAETYLKGLVVNSK